MEALALHGLVVEGHVSDVVLLIILHFHNLHMRRCVEIRHAVLNEQGVEEMRPFEGFGYCLMIRPGKPAIWSLCSGNCRSQKEGAGEPKAMDKPPWDDYYALGTRT